MMLNREHIVDLLISYQKTREEKYFTAFFNELNNYVTSVLIKYYVKDIDIAKELTSEVFESIYTHIDFFKEDMNVMGYIFAIITNAAKYYIVKRGIRTRNQKEYFFQNLGFDYDKDEELIKEKMRIVIDYIEHSKYKHILIDAYINDIPDKLIAEKYNVPLTAIKNSLRHARHIFLGKLKPTNKDMYLHLYVDNSEEHLKLFNEYKKYYLK